MSMHVMHIMHIAVLFASEKSSWKLVSCHTGCTICSASITVHIIVIL